MSLKVQIIYILYSFVFGFVFSFFLDWNYPYINKLKRWLKMVAIFFLTLNFALLYFLGIYKINYGIFHPYSLFLIFAGALLEIYFTKKYKKKRKS